MSKNAKTNNTKVEEEEERIKRSSKIKTKRPEDGIIIIKGYAWEKAQREAINKIIIKE